MRYVWVLLFAVWLPSASESASLEKLLGNVDEKELEAYRDFKNTPSLRKKLESAPARDPAGSIDDEKTRSIGDIEELCRIYPEFEGCLYLTEE